VANNDRTVGSATFPGKSYGRHTYAVDSSHVPMLSNASLVVDVIRTAAKAVRVAKGSTAA